MTVNINHVKQSASRSKYLNAKLSGYVPAIKCQPLGGVDSIWFIATRGAILTSSPWT